MTETNNHLKEPNMGESHEHSLESTIVNLERKGNSEDQDEFADIDEEKKDSTDYSAFTKADFVSRAEQLIDYPNIKEAHDIFKKIRVLFDDAIKAERIVQVKEWADVGNDVREFKPPYDELKEKFYKA